MVSMIGYFSAVFLIISLVQLVEYLFHSGQIDSNTGGVLIYIILWLQVVVLALAIQVHFNTSLTMIWAVIFVIIFMIALNYASKTKFFVGKEYNHLIWSQEGYNGNILGGKEIIYSIGILGPIFIVEYYNNWKNIGIWIFFASVILSALFVREYYPKIVFSSLWCYSAIVLAFVAFLIGVFPKATVEST